MSDYLIRVRATANGYTATLRELDASQHPEDIATVDVAATGVAGTAAGAMLAAICNAHLQETTKPRG